MNEELLVPVVLAGDRVSDSERNAVRVRDCGALVPWNQYADMRNSGETFRDVQRCGISSWRLSLEWSYDNSLVRRVRSTCHDHIAISSSSHVSFQVVIHKEQETRMLG